MWISLTQTRTCWGPWRLKTCVIWPPRLPCPLMVTIPACTGTCTWNQSPWFHSIRLGQQQLEVETCNRVRCSISCYNIHKDKSKKESERDRIKRVINKITLKKQMVLFLLFICIAAFLFTKLRRGNTQIRPTALSMRRYLAALLNKNQVHTLSLFLSLSLPLTHTH